MPAFIRLKYSYVTSLMVGCDSFIVNCCAFASVAARTPPATMPAAASLFTPASVFRIICIGLVLPTRVCLSFGQQIFDADQRDVRNVGDQRERDQINDHERDDAAIDRLELEAEHRLRDENVDAE